MSYAGEYREYPKPCQEGKHSHQPNGACHVCGIQTTYDGYSLHYAELLTLRKENEELKNELKIERKRRR